MRMNLEIVTMNDRDIGWEFVTVLNRMDSFDNAPPNMQPVLYMLQVALDDWEPDGFSFYPVIIKAIGAVYYSAVSRTLTYMVIDKYLEQLEA